MSRVVRTLLRRTNTLFNQANTAAQNNAHTFVSTGNVVSVNVIATGLIYTASNVSAGNLTIALNAVTGNLIASQNITCGNVSITNNVYTGNIIASNGISATGNVTGNFFYDTQGHLRSMYYNSQGPTPPAGYTAVSSDAGKIIFMTTAANVIITATAFNIGDVIRIINGASATLNIVAGPSAAPAVTLYLANVASAPTRNMWNLATHATATLYCSATNVFYVTGSGIF